MFYAVNYLLVRQIQCLHQLQWLNLSEINTGLQVASPEITHSGRDVSSL
jgi:hypothetical protein